MKLIKQLEKQGFEIIENNIIDDKHLDSFWYEGFVLRFKYCGKVYDVSAEGDIRIFSKGGTLVYDGKERNEGFKFKLKDDNSLKKIGNNYDDDYYWDENNWWEINCDEENWDEGVILNTLDELKDIKLVEDELRDIIEEKLKIMKGGKNENILYKYRFR